MKWSKTRQVLAPLGFVIAFGEGVRLLRQHWAEQRLRDVVAALEVYRSKNGTYPSQIVEEEIHYTCPACDKDSMALPEQIWIQIGRHRKAYDFVQKRWSIEPQSLL